MTSTLKALPSGSSRNASPYPALLSDRQAPCDIDKEAWVLGSAIKFSVALDALLELVDREDFYWEPHRKVYDVIAYLADRGPVDEIGFWGELRRRDQVQAVGGEGYVEQLCDAGLPVNAEYHCRQVAELGTLRRLLGAAGQIQSMVYERELEPTEIHGAAESLILGVGGRKQAIPIRTAGEVVGETLCAYLSGGAGEPVIDTGFPSLNEMLDGGWLQGELSIVAGRPSMGKTAVSLEFAMAAARRRTRTAIIILESNRRKIMARLLSGESGVPLTRILRRQTTDDEKLQVYDAGARIEALPLVIVDESGLDLSQLRSVVRRVVREHQVELVIIDQLQQIDPPRAENENAAYTLIIYGLEKEAKRQHVHIQVLAQLSRNNERRDEKRPMLSDLRSSGSIEQSAQIVIAVHRPDYYHRHKRGEGDDGNGPVELLTLKNRDGAVGVVRAQGALSICRIWEPDWKHGDDQAPPDQAAMFTEEDLGEPAPTFGDD